MTGNQRRTAARRRRRARHTRACGRRRRASALVRQRRSALLSSSRCGRQRCRSHSVCLVTSTVLTGRSAAYARSGTSLPAALLPGWPERGTGVRKVAQKADRVDSRKGSGHRLELRASTAGRAWRRIVGDQPHGQSTRSAGLLPAWCSRQARHAQRITTERAASWLRCARVRSAQRRDTRSRTLLDSASWVSPRHHTAPPRGPLASSCAGGNSALLR